MTCYLPVDRFSWHEQGHVWGWCEIPSEQGTQGPSHIDEYSPFSRDTTRWSNSKKRFRAFFSIGYWFNLSGHAQRSDLSFTPLSQAFYFLSLAWNAWFWLPCWDSWGLSCTNKKPNGLPRLLHDIYCAGARYACVELGGVLVGFLACLGSWSLCCTNRSLDGLRRFHICIFRNAWMVWLAQTRCLGFYPIRFCHELDFWEKGVTESRRPDGIIQYKH